MISKPKSGIMRDESGAITLLGLFFFVAVCMLLGLSLDVANVYKARTEMQIAADTAGHTALYNRATLSADQAKVKALAIANANLAQGHSTGAITTSDVQFGTWDPETRTFKANSNSKSAVMVTARRATSRSNAVGTFLLRAIGFTSWDVTAQSVTETYRPACLHEGFVADKLIDLQSNNGFYNGFCLHSNETIQVNQNNYFEKGTVVSLPNTTNLTLPASGFTKNDGLLAALRESFYNIRILDRILPIIVSLQSGGATYMPDYIVNKSVKAITITSNSQTLSTVDLVAGNIYNVTCDGNKTLKVANNTTLKQVVVMTNCKTSFGQNDILEDVVLGTTNTDADSINWSSGFQIGKDDSCATGGGAQLLTMGGMKSAAALKAFGAQLLAMGSINFTANADGIEGASFIAGDTISGTSNMTMGLCGNGMEDNFEVDYYRVAA